MNEKIDINTEPPFLTSDTKELAPFSLTNENNELNFKEIEQRIINLIEENTRLEIELEQRNQANRANDEMIGHYAQLIYVLRTIHRSASGDWNLQAANYIAALCELTLMTVRKP